MTHLSVSLKYQDKEDKWKEKEWGSERDYIERKKWVSEPSTVESEIEMVKERKKDRENRQRMP